ncbi:transposase [Streptomyces goshikiensis]|uniref:transposase n=1 Tax=Streptomyces goshikiensis TaxID=1942 RepID=UPI003657A295
MASVTVSLTGRNRNDASRLMPLLRKILPVTGLLGRPRGCSDTLLTHRGYENDNYRRLVWATGVEPVIARRGVPHGSALGIHRWVVERTIAWFHGFRRLRTRWERREDIHEAFLGLSYVSAVASLSSTVTPSTANVLGRFESHLPAGSSRTPCALDGRGQFWSRESATVRPSSSNPRYRAGLAGRPARSAGRDRYSPSTSTG